MRRLGFAAAALLLAAAAAAAQAPSAERRAETEADHKATLARLGIASLRPGADGWRRDAPNAANYDESRVPVYRPFPALLVTGDGRRVRDARMWREVRRPEIAALLEREMYGRVPATAPRIVWRQTGGEARTKAGRRVTTRRFTGRPAEPRSGADVAVALAVTLPQSVRGRVPVILDLGFPEGFRFPGAPPPPPGPDWTEQVIARGWGYAILVPTTVQPDDGAGLDEGVIGYASGGRPRAHDDWGALRAWAWGASRALDLLETDRRVDGRRVAVVGLSRYGKAALVAMAYDERFSVGFIGSSGAGGAKLLRRDFGERIGNLASSGEYHWFAPNFLRYAGPLQVDDLPVDAHMLIAMAAPRALFIGAGNDEADGWVDPRGSYFAANAASPAWTLLGAPGLIGNDYPAVGETRAFGRLAFRQHGGGHTNGPNGPTFLDFAAREWGLSAGSSPPKRRTRR